MSQKEKGRSNRRFLRFLSDYLLSCALLLFLISTLNPFVTLTYVSIRTVDNTISSFKVTYWSYKVFTYSSGSEAYFSSYWFDNSSSVSWMLVATFSLQILTMLFAVISLVWMRKLRFIPSISSAITTVLMIVLMDEINVFTHPKFGMVPLSIFTFVGFRNPEIGYWMAYPATLLFLSAIIMHLFSIGNNSPKHKFILTKR